jgi:quercetin dioxygenase-like cupin family protein
MMPAFLLRTERRLDAMPFGRLSWLSGPEVSDAQALTIMEVQLEPAGGHSFHFHEDQEELIYVLQGRIEQWLGQEHRILEPGDAIVIPRKAVHATFNAFSEQARVLAILGPCVGANGYESVDVHGRAPWNGWRPESAATGEAQAPAHA